MPKKLKLKIEQIHDFKTVGIFSTQKDYRLCWLLNKTLNLDLKRIDDFLHSPHNQNTPSSFPLFYQEIPRLMLRYFLLNNRSKEGLLFPEPKNLDYLLLLDKPSEQHDIDALIKKIRSVPMVQAAYLLDGKLGKKADSFFYDFEMHITDVLK
ncbi:MAG: IPExxxVDY family protein [Bacteroidia bacterium]|nr:MAG: IPExxxVDY family protein [Bacteroidia bacterium]